MASKQQPRMTGRDCSGTHISLLNDDEDSRHAPSIQARPAETLQRNNSLQSSDGSIPATDYYLTRQSSYSTESASPVTPMSGFEGSNRSQQNSPFPHQSPPMLPQTTLSQRISLAHHYPPPPAVASKYGQYSYSSSPDPSPPQRYSHPSYSTQTHSNKPAISDATEPRRFPCRLADEYNCDKTFTTSGHASRHSKIHTAEKGVACTYAGCEKKFTRSDNMKQHLVTHKRDKKKASTNGVRRRCRSKSRHSSHDSLAQNLSRVQSLSPADTGISLPVRSITTQPLEQIIEPERLSSSLEALSAAAELHPRHIQVLSEK